MTAEVIYGVVFGKPKIEEPVLLNPPFAVEGPDGEIVYVSRSRDQLPCDTEPSNEPT